jgi:hypothetical protein
MFENASFAGTPREIGRGIGRRFGRQIRLGLERRAEWFDELRTFALGEGHAAFDTCVEATRRHVPRAFAELEGCAEGAEMPFEDLMVLNLKDEIASLKAATRDRTASAAGRREPPGCSTVVLRAGDRLIHLHNEDGHEAYDDLMFVVRCYPCDGVGYVALAYPGILPGNAPGINAAGLAVTTNFIETRDARPGVGRYFLDRMLLESRSIDEALAWATHPERAYGYHHVFSSRSERRAVAMEATPAAFETREIEGLYLHTNHLVFEPFAADPQDGEYVRLSSGTRWRVLNEWAATADPATLDADDLLVPLSSHEGAPYSPCRHPEPGIPTATLATAVFDHPAEAMRLYVGRPCRGRFHDYPAPEFPLVEPA